MSLLIGAKQHVWRPAHPRGFYRLVADLPSCAQPAERAMESNPAWSAWKIWLRSRGVTRADVDCMYMAAV